MFGKLQNFKLATRQHYFEVDLYDAFPFSSILADFENVAKETSIDITTLVLRE